MAAGFELFGYKKEGIKAKVSNFNRVFCRLCPYTIV